MAQAAIQCTPTATGANGRFVTMTFTTFAPDGVTADGGTVQVPAYGSDGLPLSPAALQQALKDAARSWYLTKYGPAPVPPAAPAAFQIN